MATVEYEYVTDVNIYTDQGVRDIFDDRILADYIVEWVPPALEYLEDGGPALPRACDMERFAYERMSRKHRKLEHRIEEHIDEQPDGADPLFYLTVSVIDRKAA